MASEYKCDWTGTRLATELRAKLESLGHTTRDSENNNWSNGKHSQDFVVKVNGQEKLVDCRINHGRSYGWSPDYTNKSLTGFTIHVAYKNLVVKVGKSLKVDIDRIADRVLTAINQEIKDEQARVERNNRYEDANTWLETLPEEARRFLYLSTDSGGSSFSFSGNLYNREAVERLVKVIQDNLAFINGK